MGAQHREPGRTLTPLDRSCATSVWSAQANKKGRLVMTRYRRAALVGLLLLVFPAASSAATCEQDSAARPGPDASITLGEVPGGGLSTSKGTIDTKTVAADGGSIPQKGRSVTASVTQPQDADFNSPNFDVLGAAHALEPGNRVQIRICTTGGSATDAGTFAGKVDVFGPTVQTKEYDYVITARYAWYIP